MMLEVELMILIVLAICGGLLKVHQLRKEGKLFI